MFDISKLICVSDFKIELVSLYFQVLEIAKLQNGIKMNFGIKMNLETRLSSWKQKLILEIAFELEISLTTWKSRYQFDNIILNLGTSA